MKHLRNPLWIFIVNTLPVAILLLILLGDYSVIKTSLPPESQKLWQWFGAVLLITMIANAVYAVVALLRKARVSAWHAVVSLVVYITFIYLYIFNIERIIPDDIPIWMFSGNMVVFAATWLMPSLIYALLVLVIHFTMDEQRRNPWVSFLIAIAVPLLAYLFSQVILPLWQPVASDFIIHVAIIAVISATLIFLFFLIRAIYIIAVRRGAKWKRFELFWKIPFALIFPLLGLAVNGGLLEERFDDIFGDFSNIWFYILAVINGVALCLPALSNFTYRIILFIIRSITLAYTFYFFIVFLPFLPLSIIAIIAAGTGFLMLTPLVLFVIHINELAKDYTYFREAVRPALLYSISVVGFLIIPVIITVTYINDRNVLNRALAYMYSPDYSDEDVYINQGSLAKTFSRVKYNRSRQGFWPTGGQPYLSSWFNRIVLNNMSLSGDKISQIGSVFFEREYSIREGEAFPVTAEVKVREHSVSSRYDEARGVWLSMVDLALENTSTFAGTMEYSTSFTLPPGCMVSDYYLDVEGVRKKGLLTEKRAAMWIYNQIRSVRRDPGILHYESGNRVRFRVFPFSAKEVRKTGIEFIHLEPVALEFDGRMLQLGDTGSADTNTTHSFTGLPVVFVSSAEKESLPKVQRSPYFHFIVDVSYGSRKDYILRIEKLMDQYPDMASGSRISLVNTYVKTIDADSGWHEMFEEIEYSGGFFLDRAIRKVLYDSRHSHDGSYPVMVVVTNNIDGSVIMGDFSDISFACPECRLFYHSHSGGHLNSHFLNYSPLSVFEEECDIETKDHVLLYNAGNGQEFYLPDNGKADVVLLDERFVAEMSRLSERSGESVLLLEGKRMSHALYPAVAEEEWREMVRGSFASGIMTPLTSYIVLETEAQEAVLLRKQREMLSGKPTLDAHDETMSMSEPSALLVVVLLLLTLLITKGRRQGLRSYFIRK